MDLRIVTVKVRNSYESSNLDFRFYYEILDKFTPVQLMAHFVPTYWAEIALMETRTSGYYRMPSLTYMFAFLGIAIAGMSALICLRAKHVEFEWENEDM